MSVFRGRSRLQYSRRWQYVAAALDGVGLSRCRTPSSPFRSYCCCINTRNVSHVRVRLACVRRNKSGRVRTHATSITLGIILVPRCSHWYVSWRSELRVRICYLVPISSKVQPKKVRRVVVTSKNVLTVRGVSALEGPPPSSRPQGRGSWRGPRLSSERPVPPLRESSRLPSTSLRP